MSTTTTTSSRQNPAASDHELGALESALSAGWRRLRFGPALEEAYERDTGAGRTQRHLVCNLLGAVTFLALSAADYGSVPVIGDLLPALRWLVTAVCLLIVLVLYRARGALRGWQRETATSFGTLLIAAYTVVVASHIGDTLGMMQLSGMLLVLLHAGIGARLQFRYALSVNLSACLGYAAFAHGDSWEARQVVLNQLLLFGSVMLFATVGNYLLEYRERRTYLLQCLKSTRHEALLADAEILRNLAVRDSLTNLYNRRHFDAELAQAWGAGMRDGQAVGVLQIDVDHFKAYNDRHGHPAGDQCLAAIGAALQAAAERAGGIAARVGGEEFALLLPRPGPEDIDAVAADVCRSVRALALPHEDSRCARHVTVSVGAAASIPTPDLPGSALVAAADAALYAAKRQGRDRWTRSDARLERSAPTRVRLAGDSIAAAPQGDGDDLVMIDRLTDLLARSLAWLRFPPDLEATFQERAAQSRRRLLTHGITAGLTITVLYVWLSAPVLGDIAGLLLGRMAALALVVVGVIVLNVRLRVGWRVREGALALIIGLIGMCIVWTEAGATASTVYTAALGLCLLPLYSTLVAAQPVRYSLAPSLLICLGVATQMAPSQPELEPIFFYTLGVICVATLYSLIGGYLLELSNRRGWLLDQLRIAQLAVLRHNTEHLQRLATLDSLTKLPNRRHFEAELDRLTALCLATRQPLALLILDIDHFKQYNDGYGHPAGDVCLQRVGTALGQWARGGAAQPAGARAVPARLGGEEFGVLLPDTDGSAALAAAQLLRLLMRDLRIEHLHSPVSRFLTVSVGAASLVLGSAADARQLLHSADAALYRAKGLGRDQAAA